MTLEQVVAIKHSNYCLQYVARIKITYIQLRNYKIIHTLQLI